MPQTLKGPFASATREVIRIGRICQHFGFDPRRFVRSLRAVPSFLNDMRVYRKADLPIPTFELKVRNLWPILDEKTETAGVARGDYFHQDIWAAKKIFQRRPVKHVDIGSRIDGFIAHLLAFMPVTVIDIRHLNSEVEGLEFIRDDATVLTRFEDDSIDSLSSLHAAEHFGLGRYSDPIDPNGCFKLIKSLQRVLQMGGRLYFSVPIGRERVEFNAHRVFAARTVVEAFGGLSLVSFSFINEEGQLHQNEDWSKLEGQDGCGLFEFTKSRA